MTRAARLAVALLAALLAAGGLAAAQANDTETSDDPFAGNETLFGDEEDDPFAEMEERATLDEGEDEDDGAGDDEGDADSDPAGSESSSTIPGPGLVGTLAVVVGAGLAAGRRG